MLKQILNAHVDNWITSLTFLPNGDLVSGLFKEIRIWSNGDNSNKDFTLKQILTGHASSVVSLLNLKNKYSNDFVSGEGTASQSMIRVWKQNQINTFFSLKNEIKLTPNRKLDSPLILLPNGNLAAASFNSILIWDIVERMTLVHEFKSNEGEEREEDNKDFSIRAIAAWRPIDGYGYIGSGSDDKTIRVWKCF